MREPRLPRRTACRRRCAAAGLVAAAALVIVGYTAAPAFAHAEIVTETPEPGTGLPQAPGYVVLKFSEPLNRDLSHIEILDQRGRDVGDGPTIAVAGDPAAMRRKLGLLQPGTYTVHWTTVSSVDGHSLKGSYQFGIGDAPFGNEHVASSPVTSEGWLGLVGSFVAFVGLAFWAGALVLGNAAIRVGVPADRLRRVLWFAPLLALVGTIAWVASSAIVASGTRFDIGGVLLSSRSGRWRLVVLTATAIGTAIGTAAALIGHRRARIVAIPLALAAITGMAASGHAGATANPTLATAVLTVHLVAVGIWIFALTAAVLSTERLRATLAAFAPYAIAAALAVAFSGVLSAVLELNGLSDLTSTDYGNVIMLKAVALVAMACFGYTHNRWRQSPRRDALSIRDMVFGELGIATGAVILAVVLVSFPNPPREDAIAEQLASTNPISQIANQRAVTLADASGPFIVGITVLPPRPGPVSLRAQLIGVEAGDGLRNATVHATTDHGTTVDSPLRSCGLGCFQGSATLAEAATWQLRTHITSNRGPIETTESIPLPAPDGSATLQRAIAAMDQLRSARLHEELRGDTTSPPVVTDYTFRAPDAFTYSIVDGAQSITIGRQDYSRDTPTAPWTHQTTPEGITTAGFRWPKRYYTDIWAKPAATRIIGTATIDGEPSQIIAFVRPDLPAWLRLWVGADGLVRRMQMRAEGHLMNHHYTAFNEPVTITPPV